MGKMKEIAINKLEAADALWARACYHNDQFKAYADAAELYGEAVKCQHVIDYHNYMAFSLECDWVDATGHYDQVVEEIDFMTLGKQEIEARL